MKKAAALILVLAMALALCACGGSKSISEQLNGTKWHYEDPAAKDYCDISFTDHTFLMADRWFTEYCEYECTDDRTMMITTNDGKQAVINFKLENDTLTLYFSDSDVYVFTRVK